MYTLPLNLSPFYQLSAQLGTYIVLVVGNTGKEVATSSWGPPWTASATFNMPFASLASDIHLAVLANLGYRILLMISSAN